MVRTHGDWSTPGFDLPPVAPDTGPFTGRDFLEALWDHSPSGDLHLIESESSLIPLVLDGNGWRWVGHYDLVDYRSPLGEAAEHLIAGALSSGPTGIPFHFDSLPAEAADTVGRGLAGAGLVADPEQYEAAARLLLPGSFDRYLQGVGRKERHEIRRKHRRFEDQHGPPKVHTFSGSGDGLDQFVELHRRSRGVKGSFMTSGMEGLFASLADRDGWRIEALLDADEAIVAAAFAWSDGDGFYVYNSAFDRDAPGSPGIVLLTMLIERSIESHCRIFDFLKGDEPYKYRLGATPRPLFRLMGST